MPSSMFDGINTLDGCRPNQPWSDPGPGLKRIPRGMFGPQPRPPIVEPEPQIDNPPPFERPTQPAAEKASVWDALGIGMNTFMGPIGWAGEFLAGDEHKEEYSAIDKILESKAGKDVTGGISGLLKGAGGMADNFGPEGKLIGSLLKSAPDLASGSYQTAKGANEMGRSDSVLNQLFGMF